MIPLAFLKLNTHPHFNHVFTEPRFLVRTDSGLIILVYFEPEFRDVSGTRPVCERLQYQLVKPFPPVLRYRIHKSEISVTGMSVIGIRKFDSGITGSNRLALEFYQDQVRIGRADEKRQIIIFNRIFFQCTIKGTFCGDHTLLELEEDGDVLQRGFADEWGWHVGLIKYIE